MRNLISICIYLIFVISAQARTITVDNDGPADFNNIQAAIDDASDGDTVLINDGSYVENIVWPQSDNIKMVSVNGADATIIDGSGENKSVVDIGNNTNGVEVRGFTITGGIGSSYIQHKGGGILVRDDCSALITNCKVTGNGIDHHPENPRGYGTFGCIFIGVGSNVIIEECEIYDNGGELGGVFYRTWTSDGAIKNCLIYNNDTGFAGGIFCQHSPIEVYNNTIVGNNGNGLHFYEPWPRVRNNIISSNSGYAIQSDNPDAASLIAHNNIWDNAGGDYIYFQAPWNDNIYIVGRYGNISADPCFVDPGYWADVNDVNIIVEPNDPNAMWVEGDCRLLPTSPCIDAGDPNYVGGPDDTDLDGNVRVMDGDEDGVAVVDMGAYEYRPAVEAEMQLTPQTLNCAGKGKYVKAHMELPEGILPEDIDVNAPAIADPPDVDSEYIKILGGDAGPVKLEIAFDRAAFCDDIGESSEVEVTVTGYLTTGREFYAIDTITIKKTEVRRKPINQAQLARRLRRNNKSIINLERRTKCRKKRDMQGGFAGCKKK